MGCSEKRVALIDAFPHGALAAPWALQGPVWSGTFAQAAEGLGVDADRWKAFSPERVWLAVYQHDTQRSRRMTVRAFAMETPARAQQAYLEFVPAGAKAFKAGDEGVWTTDGVFFRWGRLVFDVFNSDAKKSAIPEQAVYLVAFLEKNMPRGLPEQPQ